MKKAISIILNVLSIISAAVLLILAAFCAYDWITIAKTPFAYSFDFWMVLDYYAVGMLITSIIGLVVSVINYIIAPADKLKTAKGVLIVLFIIGTVVSIVFYLLPFNV